MQETAEEKMEGEQTDLQSISDVQETPEEVEGWMEEILSHNLH